MVIFPENNIKSGNVYNYALLLFITVFADINKDEGKQESLYAGFLPSFAIT
ncbi:MAG: hypothetical protein NVS3B8_06590 [Chitinophagaceae bacterium]